MFFLIFLQTTLHIVKYNPLAFSYPYEEKNRIFLMMTFFLSSEISCWLQDSLGDSIHVIVEYNQAGSEIICRQIIKKYSDII